MAGNPLRSKTPADPELDGAVQGRINSNSRQRASVRYPHYFPPRSAVGPGLNCYPQRRRQRRVCAIPGQDNVSPDREVIGMPGQPEIQDRLRYGPDSGTRASSDRRRRQNGDGRRRDRKRTRSAAAEQHQRAQGAQERFPHGFLVKKRWIASVARTPIVAERVQRIQT